MSTATRRLEGAGVFGKQRRRLAFVALLAIVAVEPIGCAVTQTIDESPAAIGTAPTALPAEEQYRFQDRLVSAQALLPYDPMAGKLWDFEPLSGKELTQFLSMRLPPSDAVPSEATYLQVLEQSTGKKVLVIPVQCESRVLTPPHRYLRLLEGVAGPGKPRPWPGVTVGFLLQQLVDPPNPEGSFWQSYWNPSYENQLEYVYVVLVTKRHILFLRVPRDGMQSPASLDAVPAQQRRPG